MTITVTDRWAQAMQRALKAGLKPTRLANGTYRVRSGSGNFGTHVVTLDAAGHICHCSNCPGWEKGGRQNPCRHAGAVAIARAYEMGAHLTRTEVPAELLPATSTSRRGQFYREA